jgi:hypothetical protein
MELCALCPVSGGAVKPTVHPNDGEVFSEQSYPSNTTEHVWCHVFCVINIPEVDIGDEAGMTEISLAKIDKKRFRLTCDVCKTRSGACVECEHGKCKKAYHSECGRKNFVVKDNRMD